MGIRVTITEDGLLQEQIDGPSELLVFSPTTIVGTYSGNVPEYVTDALEDLDQRIITEESVRSTGDENTLESAKTYANERISNLINSAPAVLDTLKELADAIGNDSQFIVTVNNRINNVEQNLITETNARIAQDALLIPLAQKGVASGVATLNSEGKIPNSQLPATSGVIGTLSSNSLAGLLVTISPTDYVGFVANISVIINDGIKKLAETFQIIGANNDSQWLINVSSAGNNTNVQFDIDKNGNLYYADALGQDKSFRYKISPL